MTSGGNPDASIASAVRKPNEPLPCPMSKITPRRRASEQRDREFADSPLEGAGFEPSVPPAPLQPKYGANESRHRGDAGRFPRDRWFESGFLQQRVACKPENDINIPVRRGSTGACL